jgi:hypothetical protein
METKPRERSSRRAKKQDMQSRPIVYDFDK